MHIQHEENSTNGRFYVTEDGNDLAEMVYTRHGDKQIVIQHTEVDSSLEGKGVGKDLVAAGVAFAREQGLSILPLCSYAKHVMERTPEYADVLFKS